MKHRVLFFGGRNYSNAAAIMWALEQLPAILGSSEFCVIHGDARGADKLTGECAKARGIPLIVMPANWDFYGRPIAGTLRNTWVLDYAQPTYAVGFPGGPGSSNMRKQCRERGLEPWLPYGT
jgi:hypothetical protein